MQEEYYDEDGFKLHFEEDVPLLERQFYLRAFPNVSKIADRKVHCTACHTHIGTAPVSEAIIRMHPVLKVTHCRSCHAFYSSGEFDKGEDGSELYCRWCGQGGEVYCCSKCPYVFCKSCIVQNLSRVCVQDIARNENWHCFGCAPRIVWHMRAQHWALMNYINKQKKMIKSKNLSAIGIQQLMKQDNTVCCSTRVLNKRPGKKAVTYGGPRTNIRLVNEDFSDDSSSNDDPEASTSAACSSSKPMVTIPAGEQKLLNVSLPRIEVATTPQIKKVSIPSDRPSQQSGQQQQQPQRHQQEAYQAQQQLQQIAQQKQDARRWTSVQRNESGSLSTQPPAKRPRMSNDSEVVCTPDIAGILTPAEDPKSSATPPGLQQHHQQQNQQGQSNQMFINNSRMIPTSPSPSSPPSSSSSMAAHKVPVPAGGIRFQVPQPVSVRMTSTGQPNGGQRHAAAPLVQKVRKLVPASSMSGGKGMPPAPVYHTINGFRVDLSTASQQNTFRLPNGKLIQVRKQGSSSYSNKQPPERINGEVVTSTTAATPHELPMTLPRANSNGLTTADNYTVTSVSSNGNLLVSTANFRPPMALLPMQRAPAVPQGNQQLRSAGQQLGRPILPRPPGAGLPGQPLTGNHAAYFRNQTFSIVPQPTGNPDVELQPQHQQQQQQLQPQPEQLQQQVQVSNNIPSEHLIPILSTMARAPASAPVAAAAAAGNYGTTGSAQPSLLSTLRTMVNGPHEDTALGIARQEYESKLLLGAEICNQIVTKIGSLINSNSFKYIRNLCDLKELYIHLSYLLKYGMGRLQVLQDRCVDDVKSMGFDKPSDFVMVGEIRNRNPEDDKSGDEDDCEIIEQNTTVIEVDSDDEDGGTEPQQKSPEDDGASGAQQPPTPAEGNVALQFEVVAGAQGTYNIMEVDSSRSSVSTSGGSPEPAVAVPSPPPVVVDAAPDGGAADKVVAPSERLTDKRTEGGENVSRTKEPAADTQSVDAANKGTTGAAEELVELIEMNESEVTDERTAAVGEDGKTTPAADTSASGAKEHSSSGSDLLFGLKDAVELIEISANEVSELLEISSEQEASLVANPEGAREETVDKAPTAKHDDGGGSRKGLQEKMVDGSETVTAEVTPVASVSSGDSGHEPRLTEATETSRRDEPNCDEPVERSDHDVRMEPADRGSGTSADPVEDASMLPTDDDLVVATADDDPLSSAKNDPRRPDDDDGGGKGMDNSDDYEMDQYDYGDEDQMKDGVEEDENEVLILFPTEEAESNAEGIDPKRIEEDPKPSALIYGPFADEHPRKSNRLILDDPIPDTDVLLDNAEDEPADKRLQKDRLTAAPPGRPVDGLENGGNQKNEQIGLFEDN
ncbi:uncharacterized protein LOC131206680 [Anopheles bellator]|uniref:uncharacterized protein LOC131206680 n=1 Tax=Anopheles bellator TaxID=139047 RepID=UPI002649F3DD|nr:uncharacterized protein LOC131206680 [Anopheles bellator]